MSKQKKNKNKLYVGMSGTEVRYLEQSIKYGHLEDGTGSSKKKQDYKYRSK